MKYVVKKTAMYGSSTYGPYGSYQESLKVCQELENSTYSETFFTVEEVAEEIVLPTAEEEGEDPADSTGEEVIATPANGGNEQQATRDDSSDDGDKKLAMFDFAIWLTDLAISFFFFLPFFLPCIWMLLEVFAPALLNLCGLLQACLCNLPCFAWFVGRGAKSRWEKQMHEMR